MAVPIELILLGLTTIIGLVAFIAHQIMASVREIRATLATVSSQLGGIERRLGIAESKVTDLDRVRDGYPLNRREASRNDGSWPRPL